MRANGNLTWGKDKVESNFPMEPDSKATTIRTKRTGKVNFTGPMEIPTQESLDTIGERERESWSFMMADSSRETGSMTKCMDTVSLPGLMEKVTKAST